MDLKYITEHLKGEDLSKASSIITNNNVQAKAVSELLKLKSKKINEAIQAYNIKQQFEDAGIKGIIESCGETTLYRDNLDFAAIIDELNEKAKTAKEISIIEPLLYALRGYKLDKDITEPYQLLERLYKQLRPYKLVHDYQQKLRDEDSESIDASKLEQCYTLPQSYIRGFIKAKWMREIRINPLILELHDKLSNIDRLSYANHDSYISRNGRVQIKNHLAPVLKGHKRVNESSGSLKVTDLKKGDLLKKGDGAITLKVTEVGKDYAKIYNDVTDQTSSYSDVSAFRKVDSSESYLINGKVYEKRGKALKHIADIDSSVQVHEGVVYGKGINDYKRVGKKLWINESLTDTPDEVFNDEGLSPVDQEVLSGNVELVMINSVYTIYIPEVGLEITVITGETVDFGEGPEAYEDSYKAVYDTLRTYGMSEGEIKSTNVFEAADDLNLDLDMGDGEDKDGEDNKDNPDDVLNDTSLGEDTPAADAPAADASPADAPESPEITELKANLADVEAEIEKIDALDPSLKEDQDITDHYAKLVGKKTLIKEELDNMIEGAADQISQEIINESLQEPKKYQMEEIKNTVESFLANVMTSSLQGDKTSIPIILGEVLLVVSNSTLDPQLKNNLSNLLTAFTKDPTSKEIFDQLEMAAGITPDGVVNEDLGFSSHPHDFNNQQYKVTVPAIGQSEQMFKSKEPMTLENWSNAYLCMNESESGLQFTPGDEDENTIVVHDQQAPVAVFDCKECALYHNEDTYEAFAEKHGISNPKHYFVNTNEGEESYGGKKGQYALAYGKKGKLAKSNMIGEDLGMTDTSIDDYGVDNMTEITDAPKVCPACGGNFRGDGVGYSDQEFCSQGCAGATTQLEHGLGYLFKSDVMISPECTILAGQSAQCNKDDGCFVMPDGTEIPFWEGCEAVVEKIEMCDPEALKPGSSYKVRGTDRFWTFDGKTGENPLCPLFKFSDASGKEVDLTEEQVATFICGS